MMKFVWASLFVCAAIAISSTGTGAGYVSAQSRLGHVIAMKKWEKSGGDLGPCSKPSPCTCHCDCPDSKNAPEPPIPAPCPTAFPPPNAMPPWQPPEETTTTTIEPAICAKGEVAMTNGTCLKITMEVIEALKLIVQAKKEILDKEEIAFAEGAKRDGCGDVGCLHGQEELEHAHNQYLTALNMFVAAQGMVVQEEVPPPEPTPEPTCDPKQEFVRGEYPGKGTLHCEAWTRNDTRTESPKEPTRNECATICRNLDNCMGFGIHAEKLTCVWWDDADTTPGASEVCSGGLTLPYLKNCAPACDKVPKTKADMMKVFALRKTLDMMIEDASKTANIAEGKFTKYTAHGVGPTVTNMTFAEQLKWAFDESRLGYNDALWNLKMSIESLQFAAVVAWDSVMAETAECPAFNQKRGTIPTPDPTPTKLPNGVPWSLFRNSEDTKWAQDHPECPQGVPCFCDCQCRGSPPQNFIEPPPPPPMPCPTSYPPPPGSYSLPMGAPPMAPPPVPPGR